MKINELEVGKLYTYKDGSAICKINEKRKLFTKLANSPYCHFNESGMSYNYVASIEFEEYIPKVNWSKIKVDTKVYVRNSIDDNWLPRYFAKYKNGIFYAWEDGATSWSTGNYKVSWKYYKLAEESEFCDD
jgi:hypothetical protein